MRRLRTRTWFRRQGALVQALVPPAGFDEYSIAGRNIFEDAASCAAWNTSAHDINAATLDG